MVSATRTAREEWVKSPQGAAPKPTRVLEARLRLTQAIRRARCIEAPNMGISAGKGRLSYTSFLHPSVVVRSSKSCPTRNLFFSSVNEKTGKPTKQLEQIERYVLRMARSCEFVPAKAPLNDGKKQNKKRGADHDHRVRLLVAAVVRTVLRLVLCVTKRPSPRHGKAEVSAEGMDYHASTDVGNLAPFDQNGLVHAEHDHLQNRHHEQLCGTEPTEHGTKGDEQGTCSEICSYQFHIKFQRLPLGVLREGDREEASNQYGRQHREHRDDVGVADSKVMRKPNPMKIIMCTS